MKQAIDEQFLQQIELLSLSLKDNVAGLFGGNHQSKKYGSSCEFADYRDYIEGDDISKIDWNLYGKFEKMYLKLYLDERQMQTRIYIDGSASMKEKGDYAIRLATAFSYLSLKNMDKVNIYLIEGKQVVPILENVIGKDAFFSSVNRLNHLCFEGESFLSEAIVKSVVGYGDGNSIIISDFLTENNYTDAIDYLRGKKRDVLCLQLLSEEELHPTFRGRMILHDSENDNRIFKDNISKDMLKAYQKALAYVIEKTENYCRSREAEYLLLSTKDEMREVFLRTMNQRGIIV